MEEKPRTAPYPVRMPDDLRAQLEKAATEGSRSLHAEILLRLQQSFETPAAGHHPSVVPPSVGHDELSQLRSLRNRSTRLALEKADLIRARDDLSKSAPRNEKGDLIQEAEHKLWRLIARVQDIEQEMHHVDAVMDELYDRVGGLAPGAMGVAGGRAPDPFTSIDPGQSKAVVESFDEPPAFRPSLASRKRMTK